MTQVLVLDSGATKTAWASLPSGLSGETAGLHPYFLSDGALQEGMRAIVESLPDPAVAEVYFYGAGCRAASMRARVEACWRGVLPQARISVFDDIEAVAHAWADGRSCIACVLGTGASSGLYDGRAIRRYAPSNGVWLGDEGSGAYLGKMLVKAYLDEQLPEPLRQRFEHDFPDRREQLLAQVYRGERPSAYLGSFAPWLLENATHPFVEGLLRDSFRQFYARFVGYYGETGTRACLSGGTAFHFMPQLMAAFEEAGAPEPLIARAVMPGLLRRYGAGS